MTAVPNLAGTRLRRVLQILQHSQPTMFYCSQMLSAQLNRVLINPTSHFSGGEIQLISLQKNRTPIHTPLQTCFRCLQKRGGHCLCPLRLLQMCLWDRPHCSPNAMSAAALTHYAKMRQFIAQDYERLRRNKRGRESRTEKQCLQQLRLQPPHSLGNHSMPTCRGGRLELSLPPKRSPPIYSTFPYQQNLAVMETQLRHQRVYYSS